MLQSTQRRRQKQEKLRKKREVKRIKRKSILKFRQDEHGDKSSLGVAIKTMPKKKPDKKKGKEIKIDKPKRLNKVRQNAVRAQLPQMGKAKEIKRGFIGKLIDKIFNN